MNILHSIKTTALVVVAMLTASSAWGDNVAKIGDTEYATLQAALSAVTENTTVSLIANTTEAVEYTNSAAITLDLNGKTLTAPSEETSTLKNNGGTITIIGNGTIINNNNVTDKGICVWARTGSIIIENGTFTNCSKYEATVYVGTSAETSATITINGGTYKNTAEGDYEYKAGWKPLTLNVYNTLATDRITINGGTFYGNNPSNGDDNLGGTFVATGKTVFTNPDGCYTVGVPTAKIGETTYPTLADAVTAAQTDETVTLLTNVTLSQRVEPNKNMTIDLGGFTVTPTATCGNGSAFDIKSGNIIIQNGSIVGSAITTTECDAITARSGSTVTTKDLNITINSNTGACIYPFSGAKAFIESGVYKNITTEDYPYATGFKALCLNQANEESQLIFVSGGTFYGQDPATGDDSQECKSFLADGYVSKHNATDGYYKVEKEVEVEVNLPAGTTETETTAATALISNNASKTTNVSEIINNGSLEIKLTDLAVEDTKVTSATFNVTPKDADGNEVHNPSSPITFRLPVSSAVETGTSAIVKHGTETIGVYDVKANGDDKYLEITSSSFSVFSYTLGDPVAQIGDTKYTTLQEAINAATAGQTVTLISDVEENIVVETGKNITLDLGGFTLNGKQTANTHTILNKGTLTVQNGTVKREGEGSSSYYIIENQGTLNLNATVIGSASASLIRNNAEAAVMNITDGTYTQTGAFVVLKNDLGTVNVSGGTFTTQEDKAVLNNWSTMKISGGTFNGQILNGAYDTEGNTLTITDGTFNSSKIRTYLGNGQQSAPIKISGGTFTNAGMTFTAEGDATKNQSSISGGTFSSPVCSDYCAEGFAPKDNGDGTYGVTEEFIIVDGEPIPLEENKTLSNIKATYTRTMPKGTTWGTVCVPFTLTQGDGTTTPKLYTFDSISGSTLIVNEAGETVEPGTPVLFLYNGTGDAVFTTTDANVNTAPLTTPTSGLVGTYTATSITSGLENIYFINDDKFHQAKVSLTVPAYRAYIIYNNTPASGSAKPSTLFINIEGEVNAINATTFEDLGTVTGYYTPDGTHHTTPQPGLNIIRMSNGKTIKLIK